MGDATLNAPKNTGTTKPRLSLLSSKQSAIRLKSDDQIDQNHQPQIIDTACEVESTSMINSSRLPANEMDQVSTHKGVVEFRNIGDNLSNKLQEDHELNAVSQNDEDKMNISKEDLIRLLSLLKTELQSKEIALAAIKCEQLKRVINPVEISRSSLANAYIALQDRLRQCDQNNNSNNDQAGTNKPDGSQYSSASHIGNNQRKNEQIAQSNDQNEDSDRDRLNILNTLLELLDRHPLLALPRDSIYCLDYNCSEQSTKNYLNLKIQHLDNLISQHRRYRYYMNARLKRSEQRSLDLARELEYERSLKREQERSVFRATGRATLLKHIEQLNETIEKEKSSKHAIVMTLLNEILDERERSEVLVKKLADHDSNINVKTDAGEKISKLEAELNNLNMQLKMQSMVFTKEREGLQARVVELETENKNLKTRSEHKDLRTTPTKSQEFKEHTRIGASSPSRTNTVARQSATGSKQTSNPTHPAIVTRSSISSPVTKSLPMNRSSSNASNTQTGRIPTQSSSMNGGPQATSRQTLASTTAQRSSDSSVAAKSTGANSEPASVRPQPLFKSASVLSTSQQVRNLKNSVSSAHSSPNNQTSTINQPTNKPQVPAKPAQLLDQQRSSLG